MSVYNPIIPLSTDLISNSQSQLYTNFFQADAQFGQDHINFDNSGSNGSGHHRQVTIDSVLGSDPTISSPTGVFYTKADGAAVTQPFFINGTRAVQLAGGTYTYTPVLTSTGVTITINSANGFYYLCGGIKFFFGNINYTVTGTPTNKINITLPTTAIGNGTGYMQFAELNAFQLASIVPAGTQIISNNNSPTGLSTLTVYFQGYYL